MLQGETPSADAGLFGTNGYSLSGEALQSQG